MSRNSILAMKTLAPIPPLTRSVTKRRVYALCDRGLASGYGQPAQAA